MFRTSNPALRNNVFAPAQTWDDVERQGLGHEIPEASEAPAPSAARSSTMTLQGTVNKTGFLLTLCTGAAVLTWGGAVNDPTAAWPMLTAFGGAIAGLITALICIFAPKTSPITAPLYAIFEGAFLGGVSYIYAKNIGHTKAGADGALNTQLIFNAILLTFGIAGGMLAAYSTKLIRPNRMFYNAVISATFGLCLYGLVAFIAALFGHFSLASVYDPRNGGMISIGFSGFVVVLASANLILDFDIINNGVRNRAPKYMEWYGGFSTLVTLVWLYLEVLRLLSKLQSRK